MDRLTSESDPSLTRLAKSLDIYLKTTQIRACTSERDLAYILYFSEMIY